LLDVSMVSRRESGIVIVLIIGGRSWTKLAITGDKLTNKAIDGAKAQNENEAGMMFAKVPFVFVANFCYFSDNLNR
jgi:hypothetical protein